LYFYYFIIAIIIYLFEFNFLSGFATDTAISGHGGDIRERELVAWAPDEKLEHHLSIEDISHDGQWDQFATNERLFGVTTDFDEELYTTKLDKSDPSFRAKEAHARKLAAEIEGVNSFLSLI